MPSIHSLTYVERFLLPALHISAILQETTVARMRRALRSLPDSLDDAFAKTIERIRTSPKSHAELGMRVLMWIHLALRNLTVEELRHALAVDRNDTELDRDNMPPLETLLGSCLGLVHLDEETWTVRFVHYSLEEYFKERSTIYFPDGNCFAAKICLTYLNFDQLFSQCRTEIELEERQRKFVLLRYAACNWGHHVRRQSNTSVRKLVLRLLEQGTERYNGSMYVLYMSLVFNSNLKLNGI